MNDKDKIMILCKKETTKQTKTTTTKLHQVILRGSRKKLPLKMLYHFWPKK